VVADFNVPPAVQGKPPAPAAMVEVVPGLTIPDKEPVGISSPLKVARQGRIRRATLTVDIEHPSRGDLRVSVVGPEGTTVLLQEEGMDSTADLKQSYTTEDTSGLSRFKGLDASGTWTLKVADMFRLGVGKLQRWKLELELEDA
jgi:serine protease